jgi:hypothetical protein
MFVKALRHLFEVRGLLRALIPYRRGLLPSVQVFIDHPTVELPKMVLL